MIDLTNDWMKNIIFEHLIVIIQTALKFHCPKIWFLIQLRSISFAIEKFPELIWNDLFIIRCHFVQAQLRQQQSKQASKHANIQTNKVKARCICSLMLCALNACIFVLRSKAHGKWKTKSDKLTIISCSNYEMSEKPIKQQEADNAFHFFFLWIKWPTDSLCVVNMIACKPKMVLLQLVFAIFFLFIFREFIYFFSYFFSLSNIVVVWCRFYSYL